MTVWAPSIKSTSPLPAVVLHSVRSKNGPPVECNSLLICGADRSLWAQQSHAVLPAWVPFCPICLSCDQTLARSSLQTQVISTALTLTLLLPGVVQPVKSVALYPKHPLSSLMMTTDKKLMVKKKTNGVVQCMVCKVLTMSTWIISRNRETEKIMNRCFSIYLSVNALITLIPSWRRQLFSVITQSTLPAQQQTKDTVGN